jgi:hypothetical protein
MKRIVITEGNVSSLSHVMGDKFSVAIDRSDCVPDFRVEIDGAAADMIGASFREPMRVVVEIGEADVAVGSLAGTTREELIHALAAARHAAEEYRRENEALVNSREMLRADITDSRCPPFDPEKHITKATVAKWLEEDAKRGDRSHEAHTRSSNSAAAMEAKAAAADTRAIIARINAAKETP